MGDKLRRCDTSSPTPRGSSLNPHAIVLGMMGKRGKIAQERFELARVEVSFNLRTRRSKYLDHDKIFTGAKRKGRVFLRGTDGSFQESSYGGLKEESQHT